VPASPEGYGRGPRSQRRALRPEVGVAVLRGEGGGGGGGCGPGGCGAGWSPASESFRRRGGAGVDVEVVRPWEANKLAAAAEEADWRRQPCFSAGSMTRPCSGSRCSH